MRNLTWIGGGLVILEILRSFLPVYLHYASTDWKANPLFFADRLAYVFLFFSGSWYFAQRYLSESSFILDVGRESLFVYVVHILILFKYTWHGSSFAQIYGKSLNPLECSLAALALIAFMTLAAIAWSWLKRYSMTAARVVSYATGVVALLLFLVRKY